MFRTRKIERTRSKNIKFNFLGSGIELFSSERRASNQRISHLPNQSGFGQLSYSANSNKGQSIWIAYTEKTEFIEVPLSILSDKARENEWVEVRILRELISLGHIIRGADISVEIKNYGQYQTRYLESISFLKAMNDVLHLNIQPAKMIEIVEGALGKNYGKSKGNFYAVFSSSRRSGHGIHGRGFFSFGSKNPLLPLLYYSNRAYSALMREGFVEFDIEELRNDPMENWREYLTPIEDSSLSFFLELGEQRAPATFQNINRSRRSTAKRIPFIA